MSRIVDRIFGRLGIPVKHDAERVGFRGDRLPDDDELDRLLSMMRPDPPNYVKDHGRKVAVITTNTPTAAIKAAVDPIAKPKPKKKKTIAQLRRERARLLREIQKHEK
jgi:hypothetical protein